MALFVTHVSATALLAVSIAGAVRCVLRRPGTTPFWAFRAVGAAAMGTLIGTTFIALSSID